MTKKDLRVQDENKKHPINQHELTWVELKCKEKKKNWLQKYETRNCESIFVIVVGWFDVVEFEKVTTSSVLVSPM